MPGIELHTAEGLPPVRRTDIADSVHRVEQAGYFDRVACWDILSVDQNAIVTFAGMAGWDQDCVVGWILMIFVKTSTA